MKILNYDVKVDENNNFTQLLPFKPDIFFRMLIQAPSGSGKTKLLLMLFHSTLKNSFYSNEEKKIAMQILIQIAMQNRDVLFIS